MTPRFTEKELFEKYGRPNEEKYGVKQKKRSVQYLLFRTGKDEPRLDVMTGWQCFRDLFGLPRNTPCDTLFLAFLPWMWEREGVQEWVKWVVNESFFSEVFITKDVTTWQQYGGLVRTDVPRHMMEGAVTFLREGFDEWKWDWHTFIEMGYNPTESYALSRHLNINEEFICFHHCNDGHTLVAKWRPLGRYGIDFIRPSKDTLSCGYSEFRQSLNTYHFDENIYKYCENSFNPPEKETYTDPVWNNKSYRYPCSKNNLDYVLTTLKNLK